MKALLAAVWLCALPAFAQIRILAITDSTDFQQPVIAPGSLASLWCTGLTGIPGVLIADGPILPTQLAGVSVYAGGAMNAPILGLADLGSYQLINIQVPWDAGSFTSATVIQGEERSTAPVIATTQWSVFFINPDGSLVARHAADYRLVTPENPASSGEWIAAYASNLGPVANTPPSGTVAPIDPLSPLAPVANPAGGSVPEYSVVVPMPGVLVVYQTPPLESNFIGLIR